MNARARAHTQSHISGQRDWRKDFWEEKGFQGMSSQFAQDVFNFKICKRFQTWGPDNSHSLHRTFVFLFCFYFKIHKHCPNLHSLRRTFWLQNSEVFPKSEDQITHSLHRTFFFFFLLQNYKRFLNLRTRQFPQFAQDLFASNSQAFPKPDNSSKFTSISQM